MPRISAEREAATRQRILGAARQVFVEKGFHRASVDDVVAASGLSVGAIYSYFRSKDELIHAAILAANKQEADAILADTRGTGSTWDRLSRALDGWWRYTIEAPGVPVFLTEAWAVASRHPLLRDLFARRRERVVTVASILLRDGVTAGDLGPDFDVDQAARAIAALLDGVVLEYLDSGESLQPVDLKQRVRLIVGAT